MFESIRSSFFMHAYGGMSPIMNLAQVRCVGAMDGRCADPFPFLAFVGGFLIIGFLLVCIMVAANWQVFTKAGKPGWAALIPIYNLVVFLQIAGKPVWWILLSFIPFVSLVVWILVIDALSKSFGKDSWFTVGLFFLPFVFLPILGFGDAQYRGFATTATPTPPATPPATPPVPPTAG